MTAEYDDKVQSKPSPLVQESPPFNLATVKLDELRNTGDKNSSNFQIPNLNISEQGLQYCAAKDANGDKTPARSETREEKADKAIKDCFGAEVFDHLKDWDWLIAHRKELRDGFKKAQGKGQDELWEIARRMKELSTVDGKPLIYLKKEDGPSRGNLIPKRYDIMLRRSVYSDDSLGFVHH